MKSKVITTVFVLVVLTSAGLVLAQGTDQENFYNACIDNKITQCESKSILEDSRSNNLCNYADLNQAKADFYRNNRNELLLQMVKQDVTMKPHRVDYFLNKAFTDQCSPSLARSK